MNDRSDPSVRLTGLRTEDDSGLVATGVASPRLSWRLASDRDGVGQLAYEIEVATDAGFAQADRLSSGRVEGSRPFLAPWPASPLASREVRWWRVRIWTDAGLTDWSEAARVEATLLSPDDWQARPIAPISNVARLDPGPAPLLRRAFRIERALRSARLYVTALGVHDTRINGRSVGPDLLEPGWTAYEQRLLFSTYDVTALLASGENVISAAIGDGWWRGELGWEGKRNTYGDTTALLAQLEIEFDDGSSFTLATDDSWRGGYGAVRLAELYHGVDVDLRLEPQGWREPGFDDSGWESVAALDRPAGLEARRMPGVQVLDTFALKVPEPLDGGARALDTGQNLTGYLRLRVKGAAGANVSVRHAEVLGANGRLETAPLRRARATDTYILAGEEAVTLEPSFTFHGFRYAEILADPEVEVLDVTVVVVASALRQTGRFECSDARVNQLFSNITWSQRGNFLALPTDCPQRDERLGWTGDIQVFAETANFIADTRTFLGSWLQDLALEQREDGCVPAVVPNILKGAMLQYAGVGWGDAATLVPWSLYEAFGDSELLRRQYPSMRAWVDWSAGERDDAGTWTSGTHLGDWLDPAAPAGKPWMATTDRYLVATAYLAHSAAALARIAGVLGETADQAHYAELGRATAAAGWRRWSAEAVRTQTGCAMAIEFGLVPESELAEAGRRLAELVVGNGGRIATGFLGTPLVLPALSRARQIEAAYRLLLNTECPGWLFQVEHGATTMWERWDAVRPDGSLNAGEMAGSESGSMISYNHYAYGAVGAWLFRSAAGLAPDADAPGYEDVVFAPLPGGGLTSARASIQSQFGETSIDWRLDAQGPLIVDLLIPPGARGRFLPPPGYRSPSSDDPGAAEALLSGRHRLELHPV